MATLVLSTLGTLIGGPIGGAIGALLGREVDGRVFGSRHEGPRLKDLRVTGSSYGDPIARHYGKVRAAGSIIWATDLKEKSEKSGGGKGRPKTRTYSYSISFAVALSSAPIQRVGRVWADGNLLRGTAGDLKTQGKMRIHTGAGDQSVDPLMAAALGARCPAYRDLAYAVFEDLALGDFGNRIPALSFEIFAEDSRHLVSALASQAGASATAATDFPELAGFTHDYGSIGQVLAMVDRLHPVAAVVRDGLLLLESAPTPSADPPALPPAAAWTEGDFGREHGCARMRQGEGSAFPAALRYYDPARDYQPGLQRPEGQAPAGETAVLEFPGVLDAAAARTLANRTRFRRALRQDTLSWRTAELDPALLPGALVTVPGEGGIWQVEGWEWRSGGVELSLRRHAVGSPAAPVADPGAGWVPPDRTARRTILRAFELPFNGHGSPNTRQTFVAASAETGLWPGAALFWQQGASLVPIEASASRRAALGRLARPLAPSHALRFEPDAELHVTLVDQDIDLYPASVEALASGANRALVGREVLQFAGAEAQGGGEWILRGLLRGRGGTEGEAGRPHATETDFILLDDRLVPLDQDVAAAASDIAIAAIGLIDAEPVIAPLDNARASLRPPCPVHPRVTAEADGSRVVRWTRRARGGWAWLDEVEQPLVEEYESYEIGIGAAQAPIRLWPCAVPSRHFAVTEWADLVSQHPGETLWVRQCGRYAKSDPLLLATLA